MKSNQCVRSEVKVTKYVSKEKLSHCVGSERNKLGLSLKELGFRTGINREMISRIESGKYLPSFEHLNQLLNQLNINFDDIIEVTKNENIFSTMMGEAKTDKEKEWFEKIISMILCIHKHNHLRKNLN
jgi:transcriptional regulator with XRE-family HTH domain